jgi:DNA gyrase/topoisomerase IV subunit B
MTNYDESSIKSLSQKEHVRARPNVYIGAVDELVPMLFPDEQSEELSLMDHSMNPGYFTGVREIIDNAVDIILLTKKGKNVKVTWKVVEERVQVSVSDDSVGVPLGINKGKGVSTPELVFGQLMSGKNFDDKNSTGIGVNGMGSAIVNFLSQDFHVKIQREGKRGEYTWKDGELVSSPKHVRCGRSTGTTVTFTLDPQFFDDFMIADTDLSRYLKVLATVYPKLNFWFNGEKLSGYSFDFIQHGPYSVAVSDGTGKVMSVVNSMVTYRNGNHVNKVFDALYEAVKVKLGVKLAKELKPADLKTSLDMMVVYQSEKVKFDTQNKARMTSSAPKMDYKSFYKFLNTSGFLDALKEQIELNHLKEAQKQIKKDNKKQIFKNVFPVKPGTCRKTQVYITEGLSAISSFLTCRNAGQAGLSLRGKIMNVFEERISTIAKNEEIRSLLETIGIDMLDREKSAFKFDEVVICTDIDPDGYHIASLLINFFHKFAPRLITQGRLFHLKSPLYSITYDKKPHIFYDKKSMEAFMSKIDRTKAKMRYNKGLGGLCPKTEWPLMVDHKTQVLEAIEWDEDLERTLVTAFGANNDERRSWLSCK